MKDKQLGQTDATDAYDIYKQKNDAFEKGQIKLKMVKKI